MLDHDRLETPTRVVLAVAIASLAACSRPTVRYDGIRYPAREGIRVDIVAAMPPDREPIGDITAECPFQTDEQPDRMVDCSRSVLEAALRKEAAAVGGTLLVGLRCGQNTQRQLLRCTAKVASPLDHTSATTGSAAPSASPKPEPPG